MTDPNSYTIWGRPNCAWCERAKSILTAYGEPYEYIELTSENFETFSKLTNNAKEVPQIFDPLGGWIGGHDHLVEFLAVTNRK